MRFARPKVGRPRFDLARFGAARAAVARVPRPGARFEKLAWLPAGVATATIVVLVSVFSGTVQSSDATLVIMGFDPDRSQLITALIIGGTAAAAVTLVVNRTGFATLLGAYGLVVLFAQTFVTETQNAVGATGVAGNFDLRGWILTLGTLLTIGVIAAWIGATLGGAARPALIGSGVAVREMVRARRPSRHLSRGPIAVILIAALLAVTVPAFGDMVNLSPDALMLNGDHGPGLVPGNSVPGIDPMAQASIRPSPTPSPEPSPSSLTTETPGPTPSPVATAKPGSKPWLAWKPTGGGHLTTVNMPAPWIGGTKSTSEIDIYTPPGYDAVGDRLYPVLYEAPTGLTLWNKGTSMLSTLDTMIDSGQMPSAIVVFIDSLGPPYGDTQCADMSDGQQWFETYISKTVVDFVDQRYKTMIDPRARGIMGMSAGGFCAPMLALRHPDVFSSSISFSGYFWAGAAGSNAARPFGNAADIESHSPALLAPQIPALDRSQMYFILVANPGQDFYGPGAASFDKILSAHGFKHLLVNTPYTHGWPQVRYEVPAVLQAWGAQLVVNGIW